MIKVNDEFSFEQDKYCWKLIHRVPSTNKKTGEFLGCIGLHHIDQNDPEVGIWIKKSAHGSKYGLEAIKALKEWADNYLEYEYIRYPVVGDNIASRKIPEVLGGKVAREFIGKNVKGEAMDKVEYRITKS